MDNQAPDLDQDIGTASLRDLRLREKPLLPTLSKTMS
jgi:hypothetical protein